MILNCAYNDIKLYNTTSNTLTQRNLIGLRIILNCANNDIELLY